MDLVGSIGTLGSNLLFYAIPFLFVLTLVVFVHEWGTTRSAAGAASTSTSSPSASARTVRLDRQAWHPLADRRHSAGRLREVRGRCERGERGRRSGRACAHVRGRKAAHAAGAPLAKRTAIVAAGPVANFIFAILVFAAIALVFGKQVIAPRVDRVSPASAAAVAGLKPGDLIVAIDGAPMASFDEVRRIISINAEQPLRFSIDRDGGRMDLTVTPALTERRTPVGLERVGVIGVTAANRPEDVKTRTFGPVEAVAHGARESWFIVDRTFDYLGKLLTGRERPDQLSGVIHIAEVSGHVASTGGFLSLLTLAAILSVSIGLMNLFPIPMLDGGHLMFYLAEAIRGRPLSDRVQEYAFRAGIAFVLMLTVFVTWNDIMRIVSRSVSG